MDATDTALAIALVHARGVCARESSSYATGIISAPNVMLTCVELCAIQCLVTSDFCSVVWFSQETFTLKERDM